MNYGLAYEEAFRLQRLLIKKAEEPQATAGQIATCAAKWDLLEDRKRVIRGKLKAGTRNSSVKESGQATKKPRRTEPDGPVTKMDKVEPSKPSDPLVCDTPKNDTTGGS